MSEQELPPDLAALGRRLAARPHVEPPSDLQVRVLAATRNALLDPATSATASSNWQVWIAVAASILLGINLSMSCATNTTWAFAPAFEPGHNAMTAEQLQALAPDPSESEL